MKLKLQFKTNNLEQKILDNICYEILIQCYLKKKLM